MGLGSGLGGQLGWASETVYGTPVPCTKFLPFTKAEPRLHPTTAQAKGITPGQFNDSAAGFIRTLRSGTVSVDLELATRGMGLLFQALMGTTVTPVQQGASAAYLQTHTQADPVGKFLTVQTGVPDTAGVVHPYTATGCKITEADFSFDMSSTTPVMSSWTIDARDIIETQALAAASYVFDPKPVYVGTDVSIKAGAFGSETSVTGVTKADVKIPRALKTSGMEYFGNGGLKSEPILNARADITGTITADYVDKTLWADRFASNAGFSLIIACQGALIASTYYQSFTIALPTCFITGDTPGVSNEDVVNGAFPFIYKYDQAHQPVISYQTTDVTL